MRHQIIGIFTGTFVLVGALGACSSGDEDVGDDDGTSLNVGAEGTGGDGATGSDGAGGTVDNVIEVSGLVLGETECSDGIDNDGSGEIDGFDPECSGPLDDDESSFATGIPGDNKDPKQDCFFDGNSGAGDDDCDSTKEVQSAQCQEYCGARVPNGCDCFGCCTVAVDGESYNVKLGGSCLQMEDVSNEEVCSRCEPVTDCGNECGRCELCPGKTVADLPDDCFPDEPGTGGGSGVPPTTACSDGVTPCASSEDCGGSYCQFGCCVFVPR